MNTSNPLPTIAHATVSFNQWGRVVIQMDEGWVYWDRASFGIDENGNFIEPEAPEYISYSRYGVYAPDTDFDARIVVVAESEIGNDSNTATEADYINALEDLGVSFDE